MVVDNSQIKMLTLIVKGYREQIPIYSEMLQLAAKQLKFCQEKESFDEDDMSKLNELIQKRQELMGVLDEKNIPLTNIKEKLAKALNIDQINVSNLDTVLNGAETAEFKKAIDELGSILTQINQLDAKSQKLMNNKLSGIKKSLSHIQAGKKAKKGYQSPYSQQQPTPRFLDKKK